MKKLNNSLRRAFTIVELVVVIAVIAALAAILIPTFVNVVNSANDSVDVQTVKNMNTALSVDETLNGKPEYLCEVQNVLTSAGYNAHPTPNYSENEFYWYKTDNIILLVQDDTVTYPAEYEGITITNGSSISTSSSVKMVSARVTATSVKPESISQSELVSLTTTGFIHSTNYDSSGCCPACGQQVAEIASTDTDEDFVIDENGVLIAYNGTASEVVIPGNVTAIGNFSGQIYPFKGDTTITTVIIGGNVGTISKSAFNGCTNLTEVTINGNDTVVSSQSFLNCSALKKVTIGKNVASVAAQAFDGCIALESIEVDSENAYYKTVDGSLYSIDGKTLVRCAIGTDTEFTVPDGVETLSAGAMGAMSSYKNTTLKSIIVSDSVSTINTAAFWYCTALESIKLPENDNFTTIIASLFKGCSSLKSITIPDNVTSIGEQAFRDCTNLETVVIGDGVTVIAKQAFQACTNLKNVNIGDNVTDIKEKAFYGCTNFVSFTVGASLTNISSMFSGMSNLEEINVSEDNAEYSSVDGVLYNKDCTELVCYPAAKKATSFTIPDTVTDLSASAFDGCNNLENLTVGEGITYITVSQFDDCDNIKTVSVSKNYTFGLVDYDGSYETGRGTIFNGMKNLESITVAEGNQYFQSVDGVLYTTSSFTKNDSGRDVVLICYPAAKTADDGFTIPSDINGAAVTNIGYNAFYYCKNLTVNNGENVTNIISRAFLNCENLTFTTVTTSMQTITLSGNAFLGCTGKITLGNNAKWGATFIEVVTSVTSENLTVNFAAAGVWNVGTDTTKTVNTTTNYFDDIINSSNWSYKSES